MRKKLILFLMLALFGSANFLRADVVEIGDGTGTTYMVPFNSLYGYSFTEQVFLASEIGTAGTINSISFKIGQEYTSAQTNQYTVWMKNVARETFASNTDYEPVTAGDVVFQGEWEIPVCAEGDWITLTLDTPFAYDGTSNLLFAMHEKTSGYSTRYFVYTSVTNSGISFYSDSSNPDPYNLDSYSGSKVLRSNRNNIQLDITTGGGGGAGELTVHDATTTNGNVPVYGFYADAYNKCEMVYPATELAAMNGGDINSLKFYATQSSVSWGSASFQVFVAEVANATISDFAGPGTVVYEGALSIVDGEMVVEFTTPYHYNGGNLLVGIYQTTTGSYVTSTWYGETVTGASISGYNYSALSSITAAQRNFLPKTTFAYTTAGGGDEPWAPEYDQPLGEIAIVAPENGEQNVVPTQLKWKNAENAEYYSVEFGTVYGQLELLVDGADVEGWNGSLNLADYDITLDNNTRYYWRVYNENEVDMKDVLAAFVTTMPTATNVKVVPNEIFTDGSTIVKWSIVGGAVGELPETHIGSGTTSNSYLPSYSFYNYSLTQQIYTVEEIGSAGLISSIAFYNSGTTKTRNYDVYMVNTDKEAFSGANDWITVTADDKVFTGSVTMTAGAWTTIALEDPFFFDGTNLAIVVDDNTGSWESGMSCYTFAATSQAIRVYSDTENYNPMAPTSYSGTVLNEKNQIVINGGAKGANRGLIGCNVYVDSVLMNTTPITERQYELTMAHLVEMGVPAYNMPDGYNVNVTGVYDYGESNFSANSDQSVLYVSGYGDITGTVKELMSAAPMAGVTVTLNGKDEFQNTVNYTATTSAAGTYMLSNVKLGTYTVTATYDGCEPAVIEDVTLSVGNTPLTVDILYMHEVYTPVYKVFAAEGELMGNTVADVMWSFSNFTNPTTGGGNGGGNGGGTGNGSTFSVDFENSQIPAGWTTIDGGSPAGYGWQLISTKIGTGYGHNGSNDGMLSQSYDNNYGVVYPDNYLVTPQVTLAAGSTFSFWACAQDGSYAAEHFGVFVSDNGTSNWTMVAEWTMTAKGEGVDVIGRDGRQTRQGNWYQKTVDLSSFAGDKYIAIRHFNCSDMFYLDVDDIELTNGSKVNNTADECGMHIASTGSREMWDLMMTFEAAEGGQYGVAYDGTNFYTSNWGYSGASNNFFKYDLTGTMIEGFNISGCGTLRGMTYDGQYFYGVANASTVYCVDLANHTLVSTFTSAYGAMRGITYDPQRDGFWVIGNWSGNLTLIDRTGAIQITGPAPTSASDLAYYKDAEGVEHVYCFNNGTNDVDDYNIATNTITTAVFNFNSTPGFASGSSGGCTVGNFQGKAAFIGDIQQSPNLIGIYELGAAQGGGGATGGSQLASDDHYFKVYRQAILKNNMPEEPVVELLADMYGLNFADTLYTDHDWMNQEAGIYQYGVEAVYPWMQRTNDNNATGIVWSNELEHNMTSTLTINATANVGTINGAVVTLTNLNEDVNYNIVLSDTAAYVDEEFRKGDYTMTVALAGYEARLGGVVIPAEGVEMNLWEVNEINIEFIETFAPVTAFEVSGTGYARWTDMLPHDRAALRYHVMCDGIFQAETENNYMFLNTDNLVPGETYTAEVAVVYETGMSEFVPADFIYMSCDQVATQVDSLEASVDLANVTLTWAGGNGGGGGVTPPSGEASTFTEGFEGGMPTGWTVVDANNDGWTWCMTSAIPTTWTYYASLTLDWYRTGSNAICSGSYINGVGALTPDEYLVSPQVTLVNGSTFSFWAAATDASYPADHFGVFISDDANTWTSVQEWTLTSKSEGNDGGRASRDGNGAKLGTWYNYSVDLSAYAGQKYLAIRHFNCNDQYIMCVDDMELTAPAKNRDEIVVDFEGGMPEGWTVVDGNNDGWTWCLTSAIPTTWTYYASLTLDWYHGGSNAICSGSYINGVGALTPDEYLVSPQVNLGNGSSISFWAAATDASYPADHFGVFVSDDAATWTSVQEWTLTAKSGANDGGRASRDGNGAKLGNWYNYSVDLSAYAGQKYLAIRHFNCNDQYIMCVDDITITTGAGGGGGGTTTSAITPNAFNIFMDGEVIGATTEHTFTYECGDDVEHEYCVMFVDANYNFSCDGNCVNVIADPWGVGENNLVNAIYPNPTNGNLYINTNADMVSINIVNMLGQVVYNRVANGTETMINMAQFGNGVYMVNVVTVNGTSVQRIIVNK